MSLTSIRVLNNSEVVATIDSNSYIVDAVIDVNKAFLKIAFNISLHFGEFSNLNCNSFYYIENYNLGEKKSIAKRVDFISDLLSNESYHKIEIENVSIFKSNQFLESSAKSI